MDIIAAKCHKLRKLKLGRRSIPNESLQKIIRSCTALAVLDISRNPRVSEVFFWELARHSSLMQVILFQ